MFQNTDEKSNLSRIIWPTVFAFMLVWKEKEKINNQVFLLFFTLNKDLKDQAEKLSNFQKQNVFC